jgi:hypothetical protein
VHGTENNRDAVELEDEFFIDSDAAAAILGCTTRWVRHIRTDLDGRKIAGRWAFRRHTVVDYATRGPMAVDATEWLRLGCEQFLRELSDAEFDELTSRVRPPKSDEATRRR